MSPKRMGWVCEYGYNHYLDGCPIHGCYNRDGVIRFPIFWRRIYEMLTRKAHKGQ